MEVQRFGLGIRLDMLDAGFGEEELMEVFGHIFSVLSSELLMGLKLYGGHCKLDDTDSDSIFTIVFMGGGMHRTRKLFLKLDGDAYIRSMLASFRPYIQTNTLCRVEGLSYYGTFGKDGMISGGEVKLDIHAVRRRGLRRAEGKGITILLAPDKFKGSLSAELVVRTVIGAARSVLPGCRVIPAPIADGGDGTVNAMVKAFDGVKRKAIVTGPLGERIEAEYGIIGGNTAIIEMAQASGLALLDPDALDPLKASSRGTGELISHALNEGVRHILIGIGGSATNDGGIGAAIALGAKFFDREGNELEGCGGDMVKVDHIDLSMLHPKLENVDIRVMCDVKNPLTGPNGATMIYGKQKGADEDALKALEEGMKNIERLYNDYNCSEICSEPGTGAAGGMGAMLRALIGAELTSGAEAVLEAVRFDELLDEADLVITGEGCLDATSVDAGKAVGAVIRHAGAKGVPTAVIAGCFGEGVGRLKAYQNIALISCIDRPMTVEYAMNHAEDMLREAAERLFGSISVFRSVGRHFLRSNRES